MTLLCSPIIVNLGFSRKLVRQLDQRRRLRLVAIAGVDRVIDRSHTRSLLATGWRPILVHMSEIPTNVSSFAIVQSTLTQTASPGLT